LDLFIGDYIFVTRSFSYEQLIFFKNPVFTLYARTLPYATLKLTIVRVVFGFSGGYGMVDAQGYSQGQGQWKGLLRQLRRVGLAESFMQQLLEQKILLDTMKTHQLVQNSERVPDMQQETTLQEDLKGTLLLQKLKQILFPLPLVQDVFLKTKSQREKVLFQLFRTGDKAIAEEVFWQLKDDHVDFGYLVKRFSKGPEKDRMGLVGPMPVNVLRPNIRQTLLSLTPGETSAPLESESGTWVILRLLQYDGVTLTEALQSQIRDELLQQWLKHQTEHIKTRMQQKRTSLGSTQKASQQSTTPFLDSPESPHAVSQHVKDPLNVAV
jgi:hypothetical protein